MATRFTAQNLLNAAAFFRQHPTGILRIDWATRWTKAEFQYWFQGCLNRKITYRSGFENCNRLRSEYRSLCKRFKVKGERAYSNEGAYNLYNDVLRDLRHDRDIVADYYQRRIVRRGSGILKTGYFKAKYPHINNSLNSDL